MKNVFINEIPAHRKGMWYNCLTVSEIRYLIHIYRENHGSRDLESRCTVRRIQSKAIVLRAQKA